MLHGKYTKKLKTTQHFRKKIQKDFNKLHRNKKTYIHYIQNLKVFKEKNTTWLRRIHCVDDI